MDSLNDALIDAIKALGGSKQVGPVLWPEKTPDGAQRLLLACLNEDRSERLSPDQVLMVLRMARAKGHHGAIAYILESLGYAPTQPIEPRDEAAELQREYIAAVRMQAVIAERMERAMSRGNVRGLA